MAEFDNGDWDEEVGVMVVFRVRARPNPEFYNGDYGRTPKDLAQSAAWRGGINRLENVDGWADMFGEVDVIHVEDGW